MRRLLAHITLAATLLVGVGVTANNLLTKVTSDNTYSNGKTITYRLVNREDGLDLNEHDDAAKDVAEVMESRLKTWGVSSYDVKVLGNDTVEATFTASNDTEYTDITNYLKFSGREFSISNEDDSIQFVGEEMFDKDLKASIKYVQYAPVVLIPVNNGDKLDEAVNGTDGAKEKLAEDDEETSGTTLYLWSNRLEGETFSDANENPYVAEKIIVSFNSTNLFYGDENHDNLQVICGQMTEDNSSYDITKVDQAYYTAKRLVNMINATSYDYDVRTIYTKVAPASVETLVSLNDHNVSIALSKTLLSLLIAVVFVVMTTFIMFKLGAFTAGVNLLSVVYLTTVVLILFGSSFNLAAYIGLALVGALNLVGTIHYLTRLQEEINKGKSLKKANEEASKKNTMLIVDTSVISVVFGVLLFFMGGSLVSSMGVALTFGGLINLVFNLGFLKLMMYFLTNSKKLQGKENLFGAKVRKEGEIVEENKEEVKLAFNAKKQKVSRIALGAIAAIGLTMSIVFGVINGTVLNTSNATLNSKLFIEVNDKTSQIVDATYLQESILSNIYIGDHTNPEKAKPLTAYIKDVEHQEYAAYDKETKDYTDEYDFYVVSFSSNFSLKNEIAYYETYDLNAQGEKINIVYSDNATLQDTVYNYINGLDIDKSAVISHKGQEQISANVVSHNILFAGLIAVGILFVYFLIRFRLSRALALAATSIAAGALTFFLPVITRLPVTSLVYTGAIVVAVIMLVAALIIVLRDKEFLSENKIKMNEYTALERKEQFEKNYFDAKPSFMFSLILILCAFIPLFGFNPEANVQRTIIVIMIGVILSVVILGSIFTDISLSVETLFVKISNKINERRRELEKKNKKNKKTSSEPEESPIIGINI